MSTLEVKQFPDALHEEIKKQAVSEDRSMKAWVIRALKAQLAKADKSRRWDQ